VNVVRNVLVLMPKSAAEMAAANIRTVFVQHDEWQLARGYFSAESLAKLEKEAATGGARPAWIDQAVRIPRQFAHLTRLTRPTPVIRHGTVPR